MTIARRLIILVAVPLLILVALGVLVWVQLTGVQTRVRYAAQTQVQSLAALGNISRTFAELRTDIRSHILARDKHEQEHAGESFDRHESELTRLLDNYADALVSDNKDQRLLTDYRSLSAQWIAGARNSMSESLAGRREQATELLQGHILEIGLRLGSVSSEWV